MDAGIRIVARSGSQIGRDRLGEGPIWVPERGTLFWVDIEAPALNWLDFASGETGRLSFPEPLGWIIPRAGRRDFIVGLKSGFATYDLEADRIVPIGDPEPDHPDNRLNDAKVDSAGRIWAGSMHQAETAVSGSLHRLDPDLTWQRMDGEYGVANGPTFSLDGRIIYHSDSAARTVYAFDLAADGTLSGKRPFLRFPDDWGWPDGMTTDAEGCLWIAHWGGSRISRVDPEGRLMRAVALPAPNITSCAFAGEGLNRLFVTSASRGAEGVPEAGALFELDVGVVGLPPRAFGG
ncbi:Sugar lactone lactonase YvrE [Methylobacterium phyllostachyos]|uniref:Sugar lactone lactonase YvrE n=1 Tax=Methylobacterium phyllostachyos TaxID=582672 RepID=A0A1H0DHS8_9HYPH|nr:SMP-30/gluconolactonase/LRE family protein [Methylobacterium phyllostachyos]SDN69807.1 Sugar lactone lactonase YvrE [Methylobacterium phyllostachyos]